jgi:hypothetical protein
MTTMDAHRPDPPPPPPDLHGRVWCRRLERMLEISEHKDCLYCFGREGEIHSGRHSRFCDFHPGQDPIHFGFPEDKGRYRNA